MKEIQDELIDEKNREDLHGISQKIVAVESALYLASQIIELKRFLTSIDQETVNIYFTEVRNNVYTVVCLEKKLFSIYDKFLLFLGFCTRIDSLKLLQGRNNVKSV